MLSVFNGLLLAASWVMVFYAYPRLPAQIPYWLNLAGQEVIKAAKSPLFFIYPLAQTVFVAAFWYIAQIWIKNPEMKGTHEKLWSKKLPAAQKGQINDQTPARQINLKRALVNLRKEFVLLELIFFNLIFIHIQRSLIWLAHGLSPGVNKFYFFSLIIIILLLIPYYRLRRSLIIQA